MRAAPRFSPVAAAGRWLAAAAIVCGACGTAAWAETPTPLPMNPPPDGKRVEQKIEHITHEDAGSRIDERRYGGQTQSITVQPKVGNVPAYDINPNTGIRRAPAQRDGAEANTRTWNVLGF